MGEEILLNKSGDTVESHEKLLLDASLIQRIYKHKGQELSATVWRALRTDVETEGPLHPDFYRRQKSDGSYRDPDVTIQTIDGFEYVVPKLYKDTRKSIWKVEGASLFDKEGVFGNNQWDYFEIPAGTEVPEGILIIRDDKNKRYDTIHYSIVPNYMMPVSEFKEKLDELARDALKKRAALARKAV
ncbi:MAG: hypothetical protein HY308_04910 [Gammaproteobacteria bacterium]|nr:hypothetical protein [Gammaproteobacteria bacterium]